MATASKKGDQFRAGETVPRSGIYKVVHDLNHSEEHEVTCVYGRKFPPCNHCGYEVKFVLIYPALHIESNRHFKQKNRPKGSTRQ